MSSVRVVAVRANDAQSGPHAKVSGLYLHITHSVLTPGPWALVTSVLGRRS